MMVVRLLHLPNGTVLSSAAECKQSCSPAPALNSSLTWSLWRSFGR